MPQPHFRRARLQYSGFMTDILTITLNPAVDVSSTTPRLMPAHKMRCAQTQRYPGGGGINVTRVLQRLGADSLALYLAGGAMGQQLRKLVAQERIASHSLPIREETRESFAVLDASTGNEYRFVLPGPTVQPQEWQACIDFVQSMQPAPRIVVLSGTLPPGVPHDAYGQLAAVAKARGGRVVLDTSGAELREALAEGVWIVKPSLRELGELTGRDLPDEPQWLAAARQLVQAGQAQWVALTLGERGALLVGADRAWRADAIEVPVLSATGAGDSFLAAMVWALSRGLGEEEAFRYGVAAGTAALLTPGTDLCRKEDVLRLVAQVVTRTV
jgi:6-phosphofructokinase 2